MLTYLLITPIIGSIILLFFKESQAKLIRWFGLTVSIITFILSIIIYAGFNSSSPNFQFAEQVIWIKSLGIGYHVGIDGISLLLLLLTTFITPLTLISSWKSITKKVRMFTFFMLFLEAGMIGVFISLDVFLFYVFWEVMLIPMYFIFGIWGGKRRIYAPVKFCIFTMAGSLFMLIAIIWLTVYASSTLGYFNSNLIVLYKVGPKIPYHIQQYLFLAFFISFAIKVPIFPLHTWLPDAHVEAPTAGSVLLAGVLLKMGTYGFLRFNLPMFPDMTRMFVPVIAAVALIGVYYGAWVAMVQPDMKKLVAYSSVSHLGYVMLGMFALNRIGMEGSILQMINHGISTGALFLIVGVIYERTHTRLIGRYSGLAAIMPAYAAMAGIFIFSSIGLPGMNGFIGEILILVGVFKSNIWYGMLLAPGAIFSATYMLVMYRRVFFHKPKPELVELSKQGKLKDLSLREFSYFIPIVLLVFWIGLYPNAFLSKMHTSVNHLITQVHREVPTNKNISMLTGGKR